MITEDYTIFHHMEVITWKNCKHHSIQRLPLQPAVEQGIFPFALSERTIAQEEMKSTI